jgi:hypothetical protein
VHPIRPDDANLLFIKANQIKVDEVTQGAKQILGEHGIVTTACSFADELGTMFSLIDHFGFPVGLVAFLFAAGVLIRLTAAGTWELRRDVGLMRAVGWPAPEVSQNVHRHMPPMPGTFVQLGLTDYEAENIVAFLQTLTDGYQP